MTAPHSEPRPDSTRQSQQGQWPFWRIVGLALVIALSLTLLYVILGPGFSGRAWSDALCTSAMLLGIGSAVPVVFDVGRGAWLGGSVLPGKRESSDGDPISTALREDHRKREKGIAVTFALALTALLIGIASIVASLW